MDNLETLLQEIYDEGIKVKEFQTEEITGIAVEFKEQQTIIVNKDKINNRTHERSILAHEFCHFKTGTLYRLNDSQIAKDKKEYKCTKYMIQRFVPIDQLRDKLKKGHPFYEIAEELDLTEDVIVDAVRIYKNMDMI